MNPITVQYRFLFHSGSEEIFDVILDPVTLLRINPPTVPIPAWARLDFEQCPDCPYPPDARPACPVAGSLVELVSRFGSVFSYAPVKVEVVTRERIVSKDTTAQRGLSSLMGLLIATSGCPLTDFFRPMARFHLPFASEEETLWRASSSYLLVQYFARQMGQSATFELTGLIRIYDHIQNLNLTMSKRLRAAAIKDSSLNALILLDLFAKSLPPAIERSLEELRYLFQAYVEQHEIRERDGGNKVFRPEP
jgi:hypothetical protein